MTQRIDFDLCRDPRSGSTSVYTVAARVPGSGVVTSSDAVQALLLYAILHELRSMK